MTKEELLAYAKEQDITLSDEQVETFIALGVYPSKVKASTTDLDKAKNFEGVVASRNELKSKLDETTKKLKEFEDKQTALSEEEKKKQGKYEELEKELKDKITNLDNGLKSTTDAFKNKLKNTIVDSKIRGELLKANCNQKYVDKAIRLFDADEIGFEITDEKTFEYKTKDITDYMKKFVEENPFFFNEQNPDDDEDENNSGGISTKTPKRGDMKTKDKKVSDIENKFPALRRVN